MSWVAVAIGAGGAVAGAYGSNRSAAAARSGSRGAGSVDITHSSEPGLGSGNARQDIYGRARDIAVNPGPGFDAWNAARGSAPAAAKPGGGGGRGDVIYQNGQAGVMGRGGKFQPVSAKAAARMAGGGAAAPAGGPAAPAPFNGVTPQTNTIRDAMIANAQGGNPLYETAQDYTSGTLKGEDQNAYRAETFNALRDVDDPDLARLKSYLFSQLEGEGGDDGGWGPHGVRFTSGGGGGAAGGGGEGPVGAAGYIKKMLDEGYGENPFLDQSIKDALEESQRAFNSEVIPGLNSEYAGSGRFGGGMYAQALARAGEGQMRGLASEANTRRAGDYNDWQGRRMDALGLGTQMDISGAASRGSSSSETAALDLQRKSMLINALGGAVGQGVDLRQFGLSGMGGLANSYSGDQQFALGATPDVTGLSLRDWGAAGDLSLGADQNEGQYDLGRRDVDARNRATSSSAGIARQQLNLARQQFNFDVFRDERGAPMSQLGGAADIIARLTDPYATTHEQGIDRRSQSPYLGSPTGEAIAGGIGAGLSAYQIANLYAQNRGGGSFGGNGASGTW